jgi:hypothetical protein
MYASTFIKLFQANLDNLDLESDVMAVPSVIAPKSPRRGARNGIKAIGL